MWCIGGHVEAVYPQAGTFLGQRVAQIDFDAGLMRPVRRLCEIAGPAHRNTHFLIWQVGHHFLVAEVADVRSHEFQLCLCGGQALFVERVGVASQVRENHWKQVRRPVKQADAAIGQLRDNVWIEQYIGAVHRVIR